MKVLAIESSGLLGGVAAGEASGSFYEEFLTTERGHGESLLPLAASVLEKLDWSPGDLDLIAVNRGPGNYTSLRIGTTLAKSLAMVLDRPILALDAFDLLASQAVDPVGVFGPVLDIRRGHVALALFERSAPGESPRRLTENRISLPGDWRGEITGPVTLFGSGVETYPDLFGDATIDPALSLVVQPTHVAQEGLRYFENSRSGTGHDLLEGLAVDSLVPTYLRPTAAEEALQK